MPKGQKTSPEVIYNIMATWAACNSYSETARETGVNVNTVKRIVDKNKDKEEFIRLREKVTGSFSKKVDIIIDKALSRLEQELDNEEKNFQVNHLTSLISTLYDKKTLADGKKTDKETGNVTVSIKLPEGIDEYAG